MGRLVTFTLGFTKIHIITMCVCVCPIIVFYVNIGLLFILEAQSSFESISGKSYHFCVVVCVLSSSTINNIFLIYATARPIVKFSVDSPIFIAT